MGRQQFVRAPLRAVLVTAAVCAALVGCSGNSDSPPESSASEDSGSPSASAAGDETAPNPFAGDVSWLAYQTNRTGGESVWLVHPDGKDDHPLDPDVPDDFLLPDWSPDGSKLVFTTRGGETEPLFEFDLTTEKTTQLFECNDPCLGDDEPAYSPDGTTVSFSRALGPFVDDVPSDCGIWLGDRKTGTVRQLTSNTKPACDREYLVRWSPDGKQLTYHRELIAAGEVTTAVFTLNADGTGEKRLTEPDLVAGAPAYSPDGEWIVFSTYPLNVFDSGDSQLYRIHPDGSGMEQLTEFTDHRATQPRYSPDGEWIVFTAVTSSSRSLWAIPSDGGTPVVIADDEAIYTHGTWQPTG